MDLILLYNTLSGQGSVYIKIYSVNIIIMYNRAFVCMYVHTVYYVTNLFTCAYIMYHIYSILPLDIMSWK